MPVRLHPPTLSAILQTPVLVLIRASTARSHVEDMRVYSMSSANVVSMMDLSAVCIPIAVWLLPRVRGVSSLTHDLVFDQ